MKLKDILKKTVWENICNVFLENYPSQKKSIDGYKTVYKKLLSKSPVISSMELVCEKRESVFKEDDTTHGIYGIDGSMKKDGTLEKFGLSLSPWSQWLGSSMSEKTLNKYSEEEIVSHCLHEMTFHGFSEANIKKEKHELDRRIKDSHNPVRFIIVSNLSGKSKWQLYFNVADETWCSDMESATIFKREEYALAILKILNNGKDKSNLIAKITIKSKKRKVLKYLGKGFGKSPLMAPKSKPC